MSSNPTNPVLGADHKPALGQTRGNDGNLEWFDSHTNTWRPAVRQHTIRNKLIRQSRLLGSYTYQRDGKGADVASFLPKDRDFGTAWAHRPPILFQLYPGHNRVSIKPQRVLMDGNRVMLDPYDHPIRDFPELPVTLSSKEKGMWIEYYMRQNKEIKPYDLMARMGKSVNGNAVRIYTLNERATKFRNTAACLSWGEKTGSAEKKAYILGLLPAGATDTRSLGKDLTKKQQEELVAANKGQFPNRRRKAKRTLEAQAPMAIPTPGFQPGASSVDGDVEGQNDQSGAEAELPQLEGQASQHKDANGPMSFNDLSYLGYGSQLGAPQNMLGQGLDLSDSAGGAGFNGYYNTYDNSNPANFLATRQPYPSQSFLNNGEDWSSLNNPRNHSNPASTSGHVNSINYFHPAQYGAIYGTQTTGEYSAAAGAPGYPAIQAQGDSLHNHPVNAPMQRRKRPRATPVEDEAESSNNRRSKRARTTAPVEAPQETSSPDVFPGGAESLLLFDENGFVITNNTPGTQGQGEALYPAVFDEFLHATQHEDHTAEGEDAQETTDAPATQASENDLPETPVSSLTQGQKRRRSSSPEDVEDVDEEPKSKRPRTENDLQSPGESTVNGSEEGEAPAPPVNVSRGQKRARSSPESYGDTETSVETPPTKRQKVSPSPDESTTSTGNESSTTDDKASNKDDASESSHHSSSSDDSDEGSEYTPSPYVQTSLKTIARPATGEKGPYKSNGRPVTGGKGKGPLKSSRRANIARKTPAKKQ